jgi:flagellar biosynthesis/type III secretory pathway M-ring protein FliF/YscJ
MSVFAAPALPLHKAGPYVAAAYIVFVVLVLAYVAILALRASRIERDVAAMRREVEGRERADGGEPEPESRERVAV